MSETSTENDERAPWADRYERDVLKAANANHIWLNAFACVNPTPELERDVGRQVLSMLNDPEKLHRSTAGHLLGLDFMRELVVRINKS